MKLKKCKQCSNLFTPARPLQSVCSQKCALAYQNERSIIKKNKEERKEIAELKEKLLTHKDYIKMLQSVFNAYIRERDKDDNCISCNTPMKNRKGDASHFYPCTYQFLRFNEDNVHLACVTCNQFKHGNIQEYAPRLEAKIGFDKIQWLHANRHNRLELSIPEIKELIKEYEAKLKHLKNYAD